MSVYILKLVNLPFRNGDFDHFGQFLPLGHAQILPKFAQNPSCDNNFVKYDQIWLKLSGNVYYYYYEVKYVEF